MTTRWQRAVAHVATRSVGEPVPPSVRVTVNFHPDRFVRGVPVLRAVQRDGVYRSQFVTGISNGGRTAYPGGDRWRWESRLFGGAYDSAPPDERPVYGALDLHERPLGAAPRFGSAHLRLSTAVLPRVTLCHPDSVSEPTEFGVPARAGLLVLAAATPTEDPLDDYVEAHVHGPLRLARDVEAVVLDPSHRGTAVDVIARDLPCRVEWHTGAVLSVDELVRHPDYRGEDVVRCGLAVARDGLLDARAVGEAAAAHPEHLLERLWHCVARFGVTASPPGSGVLNS